MPCCCDFTVAFNAFLIFSLILLPALTPLLTASTTLSIFNYSLHCHKLILLPFSLSLSLSLSHSLHEETATAWTHRQEQQRARKPSYEAILSSLRLSVAKLWHFCRVESYGSYSTGLSDSSSDLDLVVCFSDECQTLLGLKG